MEKRDLAIMKKKGFFLGINITGSSGSWNLEARRQILYEDCIRQGVKLYFSIITIGALKQKNQVKGITIAGSNGYGVILGDIIIDATGDGYVAAFAGADYTYGSEKDGLHMWYSLAQFTEPGKTRNNFTSTVKISDLEDYNRAIMVGRRRSQGFDHGIYIASRETRHITGEYIITLTDLLKFKKYQDTIALCFSNYDIKGKSNSEWINWGLLPPDMTAEIPYRAVIPRGLDNLFVVGKAISASHDALPGLRMQADLQNLGAAIGIAAARCICEGISIREINIRKLQEEIVEQGLIPDEIVKRKLTGIASTDLSILKEWINKPELLDIGYNNVKEADLINGRIPLVELLTNKDIIPEVTYAFSNSNFMKERLLFARILAWYGLDTSIAVIIARIKKILANGLQRRDIQIDCAGIPPDQGAVPEAVHLLYTVNLSKAKAEEMLDLIKFVIPKIKPIILDFMDKELDLFNYIDAICCLAEKVAKPDVITYLSILRDNTILKDLYCHSNIETVDWAAERKAYLEIRIASALAHCGSLSGFQTLIYYLDDVRVILSDYAYKSLRKISKKNFRKQSFIWKTWLSNIE